MIIKNENQSNLNKFIKNKMNKINLQDEMIIKPAENTSSFC